jgi:hypothetical protein
MPRPFPHGMVSGTNGNTAAALKLQLPTPSHAECFGLRVVTRQLSERSNNR